MFRRKEDSPATPIRYKMRQKLIALGDDFVIENEQGEQIYFVDGKFFRLRETLAFKDMDGNELAEIQQRMLRLRETMAIKRSGQTIAEVKKAIIAPLRDRFIIDVKGGENLVAQGNILDHEYTVKRGGAVIAEVSKKWFRLSDIYGVEIAAGEDEILILSSTVVIDMMMEDED